MAIDQTLVLVVDDDLVSRELLSLLLTRHGYTVKTAASGAQALEYLHTCDALPHAILADLQMPGISGATLARALREICGGGTVLIAISGSSPDESACRHYDAFLLKPFTIDELTAVIANGGDTNSATLPAASEEVPALNPDVYAKLSSSMSPQKLEQLFTLCLDDIARRIVTMREAASTGNEISYKREAHAIKGGCGMIGATELQRLATTMETKGLAANHVATLDEFLVARERLKRMLNARETATM